MKSFHDTIFRFFSIAIFFVVLLFSGLRADAQNLSLKQSKWIGNELVNDITTDRKGSIYVLTFNQLYQINQGRLDSIITDTIPVSTKFRKVYVDNNDQIWIATYNRLLLLVGKDGSVKSVEIVPQLCSVNFVARDDFDNLWLALSSNQIKVYGHASKSMLTKTFSFPSAPRAIHIDTDNNKWIGTETGLYYIAKSEKPKKINTVGTINSIKESRAFLYFTAIKNSEQHFYQYDKKKKKLKEFILPTELQKSEIQSFEIDAVRNAAVFASNFLAVLDLKTGSVKSYRLPSNALRCIRIDKDGTYWIGTEGKGLFVGTWDTH